MSQVQGDVMQWMAYTTGRLYALSVLAIVCGLVVGGVVFLWTVQPKR